VQQVIKGQLFGDMISDFSVHYGELERLVKEVLQEAMDVDEIGSSISEIAARWVDMKAEASDAIGQQVENPNANLQENASDNKTLFINENEFRKVAQLKRDLTGLSMNLKETKNEVEKLQNSLQSSESNSQYSAPFVDGNTIWLVGIGSKSIGNANELVAKTLEFIQELDFSPDTVRHDLAGPKFLPKLLFGQSEKIEKATSEMRFAARTLKESEDKLRALREKLNSDGAKKQAKAVRRKTKDHKEKQSQNGKDAPSPASTN
jgi:negative regulator of replication initiation